MCIVKTKVYCHSCGQDEGNEYEMTGSDEMFESVNGLIQARRYTCPNCTIDVRVELEQVKLS